MFALKDLLLHVSTIILNPMNFSAYKEKHSETHLTRTLLNCISFKRKKKLLKGKRI